MSRDRIEISVKASTKGARLAFKRLERRVLLLAWSGRLRSVLVGLAAAAGILVLDLVVGAPWWQLLIDVSVAGFIGYAAADFLRRFRSLERQVAHLMGQRRLERGEVSLEELTRRLLDIAHSGNVSIEDLERRG